MGRVKSSLDLTITQFDGDDLKFLLPKPETSGHVGFLAGELDLGPSLHLSLSLSLSHPFFFNKQFFFLKIQFYEDKWFIMLYFILEYSWHIMFLSLGIYFGNLNLKNQFGKFRVLMSG